MVSADGLLLANIGQRSFLAIDSEAECAVGFLAEELVKDTSGFKASFLPKLCSMTMAAIHHNPSHFGPKRH
jgi:hypothetical protein